MSVKQGENNKKQTCQNRGTDKAFLHISRILTFSFSLDLHQGITTVNSQDKFDNNKTK